MDRSFLFLLNKEGGIHAYKSNAICLHTVMSLKCWASRCAPLGMGKNHDEIRVVCDQIGTPTYCFDLIRYLVDMCESEKYGYSHAINEGGHISWYDFCVVFYEQYGLKTRVIPVATEKYGLSKAKRPVNSRLDKSN